jgi:hypothetical protein
LIEPQHVAILIHPSIVDSVFASGMQANQRIDHGAAKVQEMDMGGGINGLLLEFF